MNKKLAASLTIAIFLLSTIAVFAPVQAHFTLGKNNEGVYPYTVQNFDPHVPGVIGYVWPGGGENMYLGSPNLGIGVSPTVGPGYTAPYPVNALKGAGVYNPSWTQNLAQLDGHEYSPSGAIVVNSQGDLIFAINATHFERDSWDNLYIAIPPEFTIPNAEQVVTTITNNYENVLVYQTVNQYDRYIPGWHLIRIITDPSHKIDFTSVGEWYYVRINGVTAPSVAGKYFFKMYLYDSDNAPLSSSLPASCDEVNDCYWVPTQNWPVLLVKGELDPAIITGTILYGGYNSSLYGKPVELAGKVWAQMTTKLDPYTGKSVVDCTKLSAANLKLQGCADAVGYFNETADGHYEVEGVAPGIYNIYAQAAGYPLALIAANVQVMKGQSLHFDGYLNPGPVIHGDVFSKHSFGSEPWPYNMYVKIELYDKPTQTHVPNSTTGPVVWSPLPCVAGGQDLYYPGNSAASCGDPRAAQAIAFPWDDWTGNAGGVFPGSTPSTDPQGVGPGQTWFVTKGSDKFHYEFGAKGMFGAPRDLDGHVPQKFATWVNGLTAGRYYARAWVFRYVQSALDGSTFQEYSFQVQANEWAGDISIPIDLRISSWINKTVHFHNNAGTLSTDPVETGARYLAGELFATTKDATMYAYNLTKLASPAYDGKGNAYVTFYGLNDTWLGQNYGIPAGTYKPVVKALGYIQQTQDLVSVTLSGTPIQISNHLYRGVGFNFTVYSIDWERPRVNRNWIWEDEAIEIGIFDSKLNYVSEACYFCDSNFVGSEASQLSNTYFVEIDGGGTGKAHEVFFGLDAKYHYVGGRIASTGFAFTTSGAKNVWGATWSMPTAFDSGQYSFLGWTYGYIQNKDYTVFANKGQIADMKINLIIGVNVTLDILFKTEKLISGTPYDMSARVRLFDDSGRLVAEWMSSQGVYTTAKGRATGAYIPEFSYATGEQFEFLGDDEAGVPNFVPAGTNLLRVNLAGFPMEQDTGNGYGDPVFTPASGDWEIDFWPSDYWSVAKAHFPNAGILGAPDYTGGYTAEVDFVNWYLNTTRTGSTTAPNDNVNPATYSATWHKYYPAVPGLLMGESFHIIPGTQAKSKISYTEDGALDPYFLGHSMAPNHLGPYSQQGVWTLTNAPLSGTTSAIWEVDLNGYISGTALAFTWSNEFRAISWYTVNVKGAGNATFNSYTWDGLYEFYLVPGQYSMTISGPGYKSTPMGTISVTSGQGGAPGAGNDLQLPMSNIPVPEFSGIAVVALSALAASLYLLRRRTQ